MIYQYKLTNENIGSNVYECISTINTVIYSSNNITANFMIG